MDVKKVPEELLQKREIIECNWVFSLYNDMSLLDDYKNIEPEEDILTKDGIFYYELLRGLKKAGYNTADHMSIYQYLEDHIALKKGFESRGGISAVNEIKSLLSENNAEAYYDELIKSNLLIRLYNAGFPVIDKLNKFKNMTSEEVYDYYDYNLANISIGKIEKIQSYNLSDETGYKEWFDRINSGGMLGYRVNSPILNYMMAGIHKSNLMLHIAGIGQGKTTTAILLYVLGLIKNGENIVIISNEQGVDEFRNMLIPCVLFNEMKCKVKGLNRQKFVIGGFNDEQKEAVNQAIKWLANQSGKVEFVPLMNYDITNIRKVIKKYSRINYGCFLVDTIKPLDEADSAAWAKFSEMSKELFLLSKQTDSAIICTAQASGDSLGRKYMDLSCIAKSKAIAETATQVVSFRPVTSDEIEKIEPWQYKKNSDGSTSKVKITYKLDPNEHYICVFLLKNRFGATEPQLIMKFNQTFCTLEEIGYYNCPYDYRR